MYTYTCMYVYIHIQTSIHVYISLSLYIYIYISIYIYIYIYICVYLKRPADQGTSGGWEFLIRDIDFIHSGFENKCILIASNSF